MTIFISREHGSLKRMIFLQFLLWEDVVVMIGLIFNNFGIGRMWYVERTDF